MADGTHFAKLIVRQPLLEDWAYLARNARPDEIDQHLAAFGGDTFDPEEAALRFASWAGPKFVFLTEACMPIAAGGFVPLRDGVYEAWLVGTMEGWASHWPNLTRECRRLHNRMLEKHAHRIQITALASRTAAHDWYLALGFKNEGLQRCNTVDARDTITFARTRA